MFRLKLIVIHQLLQVNLFPYTVQTYFEDNNHENYQTKLTNIEQSLPRTTLPPPPKASKLHHPLLWDTLLPLKRKDASFTFAGLTGANLPTTTTCYISSTDIFPEWVPHHQPLKPINLWLCSTVSACKKDHAPTSDTTVHTQKLGREREREAKKERQELCHQKAMNQIAFDPKERPYTLFDLLLHLLSSPQWCRWLEHVQHAWTSMEAPQPHYCRNSPLFGTGRFQGGVGTLHPVLSPSEERRNGWWQARQELAHAEFSAPPPEQRTIFMPPIDFDIINQLVRHCPMAL